MGCCAEAEQSLPQQNRGKITANKGKGKKGAAKGGVAKGKKGSGNPGSGAALQPGTKKAVVATSNDMESLFKAQLKNWRGNGVQSLRRIFSQLSGRSAMVDAKQIAEAAKKFGIDPKTIKDIPSQLNWATFMGGLLDPLSDRSLAMIDKIWKLIDPADIDVAMPNDMKLLYDSRQYNDGCVYIGRYSDPNHANGFRIITLLDEMQGDKRMAKCQGLGGQNEPKSFTLNAWINPDNSIVIDFSAPPKNGPKDFVGKWDKDGIKFVKDGNKWPQCPKSREDNLDSLLKVWDSYEDGEDQEVAKDEFIEHYTELAMGFAEENQFINYLENCWGVAENPDTVPFQSSVSALINRLREAMLFELEDTDDQAKMDEFFYRYDEDRNQTIDLQEFETMLNHLGVQYERSHLNTLMRTIDDDFSTTIDKPEFYKLIRNQL